ncbi:L-aspartate oxidase [Brevundimonas aurifodinae]|uniref:L-aspartate oxidase n=2 Tax=Brevundimonas TaxID=41275 RepID=A0ABV1NIV5_9CAUL|nr:MAG: L-aspartate oxidase [Brevundimonas sp. 12-68-7]OYX34905.1 MAG: L-aspartate oxidase [Brevundimonas subvibrioides]
MSRIVHDGPLIIGGGLAGLSAALSAAPRPVLVVSPAPLLEAASSAWAQGGVAAALSADDAPALHLKDTEAAGAGLVDHAAAQALTADGRSTVEWLASLGAPFDRDAAGDFAVSLEAAHSRARVARVGGDGAGRAILSALVDAARVADHVTVWEGARLRTLIQDATGRVRGAVIEKDGDLIEVLASAVVLATGGAGGLFGRTTTPMALKGEGLALAWAAGAEILDPEFVQFHPTAIDVGLDPMPLATEALRGDGARLIDAEGRYLLGPEPDADLKARDIVARAVHAGVAEGRGVFLDCRAAIGDHFPQAFPAVFAACMAAGLDPRLSPIPVAPAAHYHMGGIVADPDGRTSLPGLFAVGECAATGVHGANRLASNSLLEAAAFGRRTGRAAAEQAAIGVGALRIGPIVEDLPDAALAELRAAMSADCGVVRDAVGLTRLVQLIDRLEAAHGAPPALVAARLIADAALARRESRGGHYRSDFPQTAPVPTHTRLRRAATSLKAAA